MSEDAIEVVVVRGEKPTEEETEAILAEEKRQKRNAKNKAIYQKWLRLLKEGCRTDEERTWLERENVRRERARNRLAKYVIENKEDLKKKGIEYGEREKEKIKERRAIAYQKNKEKLKREARERRASRTREQKDEVNRKNEEYDKKRRASDPAYACLKQARVRMRTVLHGLKKETPNRCVDRFERYFGCDRKTLVSYVEAQFRDGMTWENRGQVWELDHIVPLSAGLGSADLLMKMNHYRNLQPLTVFENRSKADRLPEIWPEGVPFTREEVLESLSRKGLKISLVRESLSESAT